MLSKPGEEIVVLERTAKFLALPDREGRLKAYGEEKRCAMCNKWCKSRLKAQGLVVSQRLRGDRPSYTQAKEQKKDTSKIPVWSITYNFVSS